MCSGDLFLVPHPEVDWRNDALRGRAPPQFMRAPFAPFEGEYAGVDRTGVLQAAAAARAAARASTNPTLRAAAPLDLEACASQLDAIEDLRSPMAHRARQPGARVARARDAAIEAARQAAATAESVEAAPRAAAAVAASDPRKELMRIPKGVRLAASQDLAGRHKADPTVVPWASLDWAGRLGVVRALERDAAADGVAPEALAERRRLERGDPKPDGGCIVM